MLNELLTVERGAREAGMEFPLRHPDFRAAGFKPTILLWLDPNGCITKVCAAPVARLRERPLWKISQGQKHSFPFVQPKPFWDDPTIRTWRNHLGRHPSYADKRTALLDIALDAKIRSGDLGEWVSDATLDVLRKRRDELGMLQETQAVAFLAAIDRFLLACTRPRRVGAQTLVESAARKIAAYIRETGDRDALDAAIAVLTETGQKAGAIFLEVDGEFPLALSDPRIADPLCCCMRQVDLDRAERVGTCAVTGEHGVLVARNFSQPNLPIIQQSFLFARNDQIPSAARYRRSGADSIPVGYMTDVRLRAAFEGLTTNEQEGVTWRRIPREATDEDDLLLAFVQRAPEAPAAGALAEEDYSEEVSVSAPHGEDPVAVFEKRTERVIRAVQAKVGADFRLTPVSLAVFRYVDKANRKVVCTGTLTVGGLHDAAFGWARGERNAPAWIALPISRKGDRKSRLAPPPHVAPLGIIAFSKRAFVRARAGIRGEEVPGVSAAEALRLFMEPAEGSAVVSRQRVPRVLRLILSRRTILVAEAAHAVRRGVAFPEALDCHEALRTITVLSVLLYKLGRTKENYMSDRAFRLGQLLAAADAVHAGYCADVRGGDLPPSLLGNQVFSTAQTAPVRALAMLCQRWKPYDGWVKKNASFQMPERFIDEQGRWKKRSDIKGSREKEAFDRAAAVIIAISQARRVTEIASQLQPSLPTRCDDAFRAELLLGYIAGLPHRTNVGADVANDIAQT